jgi:hypothetical protein
MSAARRAPEQERTYIHAYPPGMHLSVAASESGSESGPESGSVSDVGPAVVGPTPIPQPGPVLPNWTGAAGAEMK